MTSKAASHFEYRVCLKFIVPVVERLLETKIVLSICLVRLYFDRKGVLLCLPVGWTDTHKPSFCLSVIEFIILFQSMAAKTFLLVL